MMTLKRLSLYACSCVMAMFLVAGTAHSQSEFYKGKTIKIIRGGGPGGSGEFQTRALMKFLPKYIPGHPNVVMEFVEGAAGRKAANMIYSSTRPDGLTIGSIGAGLVVGPILGLPGSKKKRYKEKLKDNIDKARKVLSKKEGIMMGGLKKVRKDKRRL
jgi:tripartite-type tricarboxylate transporter receptor subunit TctC